ncbi:MAG: glycosyltransferase family 4 protein [Dokdonella sp.]
MSGRDDVGAGERAVPRRRILLLTRNFPPAVGGIQRYLHEIVGQLVGEFDVAVVGPNGCAAYAGGAVDVRESSLQPVPLFLAASLLKGLALARRFKPDLVIAGSGLMAPLALAIGRATGARVAVFVYGLDIVVDSVLYQRLWLPAIRACDVVIPISQRTRALALQKRVEASRLGSIIHPGTDAVVADAAAGAAFRAAHAIGDRRLLLSVGRLVPRKGLLEFVDRSLPAIVAVEPNVLLVVIGGEADDSLAGGAGGVGARAMQIAERAGIARHLRLLGQVSDDVLAGAWNAADVHVFPIRELPGDVEGFGIVCIEAAAHGVPTVAFASGGVVDAVAPGRSGTLVKADDYVALSAAVIDALRGSSTEPAAKARARSFAAEFSWDAIGVRLRALVGQALQRAQAR